ncbi:MAG TPA: Ku protein [Thermoanaerobaculia bacterium]|nr:Ku protein [Thermoanaerobaculia bacterium]
MAARAMGSATISFGLVSVPVKLYSTGESSRNIAFNWIHEACGSRVQQRFWCPKDEEIIERDELVKGYEFAKDQYVLFSPEELKALEAQATDSIDIAEFVPLEKVERIFLDRAYYLGPDKGGDRAYRLLSATLRKTGRAALGSYSARGKQYLVLVRPIEEGLVMEQLRYADELRPFSEVPLGDGKVKEAEIKLATQLVEQSASDEYRPEAYEDEVYKRVLGMIERKIEGEEITAAPPREAEGKIIDLMEALKASLAEGGRGREEKTRKPAKRAVSGKKGARARKSGGG